MKLKKAALAIILIVLSLAGLKTWLDKPYCTLELLEAHTQKSKRNIIVYSLIKLSPQRRELHGNDPYKLYLNIDDPDGLLSVKLTVDGKPIPVELKADTRTIQKEIPGDTEFGLHHYEAFVTDRKGKTAKTQALVKVSAA
ncbi:MAG: hypothetical protein AB1656_16660 [Candidatus Omnitrophota bacterium]